MELKSESPTRWNLVGNIFYQALQLPEKERDKYLEQELHDRPLLRAEVEELLRSHSHTSEFLETPAVNFSYSPRPELLLRPGGKIDDFEIIKTLGVGSLATVYLAKQLSLEREVALKVSPNWGEEAKRMAPLEHDHIVKVHSETVDQQYNVRLLAMQYVPGVSLGTLMGPLSQPSPSQLTGTTILNAVDALSGTAPSLNATTLQEREALKNLDYVEAILWIGARLAHALAYAHGKGVLHLDVKPENILLTPYGRPMLTDFNVAIKESTNGERNKILGGTLNYMAPEQKAAFEYAQKAAFEYAQRAAFERGGDDSLSPVDGRADLYALGLVLQDLFNVGGVLQTGSRFFSESRPELEQIREEILEALRLCLEKNPQDRFPSAERLAIALETIFERYAIACQIPPPRPGKLREMRRPILWLILGTIGANIAGSIVNLTYNWTRIVSHLTPSQVALFDTIVLVWNPVAYGFATWLAVRKANVLGQYLLHPGEFFPEKGDKLEELRAELLDIPIRIGIIITGAWMAGAMVLPLLIHFLRGPLPPVILAHFMVSFTLAWLISLTYSCLHMQSFGLRSLYFRLFRGCRTIRKRARKELDGVGTRKIGVGNRLRIYHFSAGFIPMVGALLLVEVGPDSLDAEHLRLFKLLVEGLMVLGIYGFLTGFRGGKESTEIIFALKGLSVPRERDE